MVSLISRGQRSQARDDNPDTAPGRQVSGSAVAFGLIDPRSCEHRGAPKN